MPYIKCPRCHLNYILDTEKFCKVCLVDMHKLSQESVISEDFGEENEELRLCPECHENYLEEGEDLCYACRMEQMKAAAKEKMNLDQDMDFDEDYPVSSGKEEGGEVLMDNMEVLDYADGRIPEEEDAQEQEEE